MRYDSFDWKRIYPAYWFLAAVILLFAISYGWPEPEVVAQRYRWLGYLPLLAGSASVLVAAGAFIRHETTIVPYETPSHLITTGIYKFSRNPLYMGEVVMLCGLCILFGGAWVWVVPPLFGLIIHVSYVMPEENALRGWFGPDYDAYKRQTRRWL